MISNLTHINRPKHSIKNRKAGIGRCIIENYVTPLGIICFFSYVVLSSVGII